MALIDCPTCNGEGYTIDGDGEPDGVCPTCNGRRKIDQY